MASSEETGGTLDEAAIRAYAKKRLIELGRRYYPVGIGAAFLAMLAGFFPTTVASSQLASGGLGGYAPAAVASGSAGGEPVPGSSAKTATSSVGASGASGGLGVLNESPAGTSSTYSGSDGAAGFQAVSSALPGYAGGASSGSGGGGLSGGGSYPPYPSGSGSNSSSTATSSCPLPIPSSTGTPIDPVLAEILGVCSDLSGSIPAGSVPAGSLPVGAPAGFAAPHSGASFPPGSVGWVSASGPLVVGASRLVVQFALPALSSPPGSLEAQMSALNADGVVPEVVLLAPPGASNDPASFGAWASSTAAKLPAAKLWAVAAGVPTGGGGESLAGASLVQAGLLALHSVEAPRGIAVGLMWPSDGTTTVDRSMWRSLSSLAALSGKAAGGLFGEARFVSVTEVGSLACEGMGSLRQEMGQLGAPRDEPVIATAALSVAASDAGTGSLACFASALASAGRYESRYTRGLVALSPLMPLFAGRGR